MSLGFTTTYTKITTFVTAVFTAAVGVGIGLLCYYWVWCGMAKPTSTKIWIIIGFTFLGIIALLFDSFSIPAVWYLDGSDSDDLKGEVGLIILLLIFCGVIPGIMVLIDVIIVHTRPGRERRHWEKLGATTSSGGYGKKKAPDYDKDNDPAIKKTKTADGKKKKVVYKNPDKSDDTPAPSKGGKKKLVFNKPTKKDEKPAKKKLVYKGKK